MIQTGLVHGLDAHCELSPLECTLTKNASASPLESTLTNSLDLKPFRIHTYKKRWVGGRNQRTSAAAEEAAESW